MPSLIWSPSALKDNYRLYRFLVEKDKGAASRAIKAIKKGVNVLLLQPGIGRPLDDFPAQFRELVVSFGDSGYVVRYHFNPEADRVAILAIRHQKEVGFLSSLD
jgi:plasmid stabilization system protein ParE